MVLGNVRPIWSSKLGSEVWPCNRLSLAVTSTLPPSAMQLAISLRIHLFPSSQIRAWSRQFFLRKIFSNWTIIYSAYIILNRQIFSTKCRARILSFLIQRWVRARVSTFTNCSNLTVNTIYMRDKSIRSLASWETWEDSIIPSISWVCSSIRSSTVHSFLPLLSRNFIRLSNCRSLRKAQERIRTIYHSATVAILASKWTIIGLRRITCMPTIRVCSVKYWVCGIKRGSVECKWSAKRSGRRLIRTRGWSVTIYYRWYEHTWRTDGGSVSKLATFSGIQSFASCAAAVLSDSDHAMEGSRFKRRK